MVASSDFVIERVFDVPRAMVWRAWTDPDLLAHWYGPGVETVIHAFDPKPGGVWLNEMKWGEKSDWSKMAFQEVVMEEKLVWHHSSTDSEWNIIANPMMPDWPRTLLATVTLEDAGAKTNMRLTMTPLNASNDEIACFTKAMEGFGKGWSSGFAIMAEQLSSLSKS